MEKGRDTGQGSPRRPLEFVAMWQFLCFVILICFVWAAEIVDLKHILYETPLEPVDWLKASILTAAILAVGIITVGHTYIQEKRMLRGFIIVCSYCHKVQVDKSAWQQMEAYVSDRTKAEFSHGVCPVCYDKIIHDLDDPGETAA
jgi:hypothetical protein